MIQSVVLIGAGNLATQTGKALQKAGININQVYSRTEASARELASRLRTGHTTHLGEVDLSVDLVLVAVKDDAIEAVLGKLLVRDAIIVHTAGSVPINILEKSGRNHGVFYPLQTFSKARDVDFQEIPLCLEANSEYVMNELKGLAGKISGKVYELNSEQRKIIHLAAVFACNFVNHFYYLSDRLLNRHGMPFGLLRPLIMETASKVMELDPFEAQTGPAKRFDETIINNHLKMLDDQPELRKIYSFVTESIFREHKMKD